MPAGSLSGDLRGYSFELRGGDFARFVMKAGAEDLDEDVDGVSSLIAFWPAPVVFFDEKARMKCGFEVASVAFDEGETALAKQWKQGHEPGGALAKQL